LETYLPDAKQVDPASQAACDNGNAVGVLTRAICGPEYLPHTWAKADKWVIEYDQRWSTLNERQHP